MASGRVWLGRMTALAIAGLMVGGAALAIVGSRPAVPGSSPRLAIDASPPGSDFVRHVDRSADKAAVEPVGAAVRFIEQPDTSLPSATFLREATAPELEAFYDMWEAARDDQIDLAI